MCNFAPDFNLIRLKKGLARSQTPDRNRNLLYYINVRNCRN